MGQKAVFFDIDGTLLDYKKGVPSSTIEGIKELRKNGHLAFINTGRSRANIGTNELKDLFFDGIVAGCGTYVEYQDQILFNYHLTKEQLQRTVEVFKSYQVPVAYEGDKEIYFYEDEMMDEDPYIQYLMEEIKERLICMKGLPELPGEVNKMSVHMKSEKVAEEVMKILDDEYDFISHTNYFYEVIPKGFHKAKGIELLCRELNIRKEDTYAFGDSNNDLDMIRFVQHGIAMGNSKKELVQASDYVTKDILDNGIYYGLEHFNLIP